MTKNFISMSMLLTYSPLLKSVLFSLLLFTSLALQAQLSSSSLQTRTLKVGDIAEAGVRVGEDCSSPSLQARTLKVGDIAEAGVGEDCSSSSLQVRTLKVEIDAEENVEAKADSSALQQPAEAQKGWFSRFLSYFNDANKEKPQRKFDFSVIGGPHYSTDTKLGVGLVAAGLYRSNPTDSLLPPSNVSLFGDFSTVGFYLLGIRGTHLFPHDRYRLDYTLFGFYFPSKVWGIGYDEGNLDANESEMKRWQARVKVDFLFRLAPRFYVGPMATYDFVMAKKVERPELLHGMDRRTTNVGLGLTMVYDSRDVMTNPHRGLYASVSQNFHPSFLGNDYCFSTTDWRFNLYRRLWKGGLLAGDFRGTLNFGNPSWGMMALLGSSNTMRGYYEGRYRDKHKIESTIELRQHVWRRNGLVVWAGAGTVFPKFSQLRSRKILPNYGLGYRWEFKKDVNVRLDYGFGKRGQSGFLFNINEAF